MELFKQINNEALDEDRKAQLQVIERLKKQVALFNQPYKVPVELSDSVLNNIQRYIINFDDNLNKTLNDVYRKGELKEDTGDLVLNYNLLANYLDKVNFNLANINDKRNVFDILDEITPKLGKVLNVIKVRDYTDVDLVEKILNNFKNRTYNVLLERERIGIDREREAEDDDDEKHKELDLAQLSPSERAVRRLENIILKTEQIAEKEKLAKNSILVKANSEAKTFLKSVKAGKEDISRLNKFFREREERVNREYDILFKPKVAEDIGQPAEDEGQPEQEPLAITPSLQKGVEEPVLALPQEDEYEGQFFPLSKKLGQGKRVYKKRK
jgi:hypothetical protein